MNVLISGASGLVGSSLTPMLQTGGHTVVRLARSRRDTPEREVIWNPESESLDPRQLEGIDAVVHLAGEGIADRRWNTAQKERIRSSRQVGTRKLAEAVARMEKPPKVFVCASAIGYYGDRGDEILDESSLPGSGFLPDVCVGWEDACQPVREKGIRTVNVRIGVVLSPQGGALKKMLLPFQLGAGGVIGSGQQYWSWIALDDVVGLLHHALTNDRVSGPMNATSPHPCTNREFTKTLGRVLRRPTIFPVPAFMAKLALGEMANDLLLASARVMPHAAQSTGYPFRFPELEPALRHLLGR